MADEKPPPGGSHGIPGVRLDDLTVRYRHRTVLDGLTFEATTGVVALVGPNGSGKTTLLRVLATLRRADAGTAAVAGHDLRRVGPAGLARRALAYLPQDPSALAHLRVEEAVAYAAWLKKVPRGVRADRVAAALVDLDLTDRSHDRLGALSGGTRQRAHIAQAVVHGPSVLLLDEPSTGVDAEHRVELRQLLRRLSRGRLVVLSTHLTEDIELLADRVVALDGGRVRFDGTPAELAALGEAGSALDQGPGSSGPAEPARAIERGLRALGPR